MDCCTIANTCVVSFVASLGALITAVIAYIKSNKGGKNETL